MSLSGRTGPYALYGFPQERSDFAPIDILVVQSNADPSTTADIGRAEEALGIGGDERLLRSGRGCAVHGDRGW